MDLQTVGNIIFSSHDLVQIQASLIDGMWSIFSTCVEYNKGIGCQTDGLNTGGNLMIYIFGQTTGREGAKSQEIVTVI